MGKAVEVPIVAEPPFRLALFPKGKSMRDVCTVYADGNLEVYRGGGRRGLGEIRAGFIHEASKST